MASGAGLEPKLEGCVGKAAKLWVVVDQMVAVAVPNQLVSGCAQGLGPREVYPGAQSSQRTYPRGQGHVTGATLLAVMASLLTASRLSGLVTDGGLGRLVGQQEKQRVEPSMFQAWRSIQWQWDQHGIEFVEAACVPCTGTWHNSFVVMQTRYENKWSSCTYQMDPEILDMEDPSECVRGAESRREHPAAAVSYTHLTLPTTDHA